MTDRVLLHERIPAEWREKWNAEYSLDLPDKATFLDVLRIIYGEDRKRIKRRKQDARA